MLRVMIIEDEPSAMDRYSGYVESFGDYLQVTARAYTSEEGWDLFCREKPDIIFSDIRIPGDNGLVLARKFRDAGWEGQLVIISGYDDFSYAQKAIHLSVADYLLKPVFQEDFNRILERLLEKMKHDSASLGEKGWIDPRWPEHIQRARQYIEIHLEEDISLPSAAEYSYVSPSYLSSSFHKVLGETFVEHIRGIRIEKAKRLLVETGLPLKEIGTRCGLSDPSYFNRIFRKSTGMSPGSFRRIEKEKEE